MNKDGKSLVWCEGCQDNHDSECPLAGAILDIPGQPLLSKAEASLPRSLDLKVTDGQKQVIAGMDIPKGMRFGPYEADLVMNIPVEIEEGFFLKIFKKNQEPMYLHTTDEQRCNWMCLVVAASNGEEQNLMSFQYKDGIFFSATRDIAVDEKLLVWYAPHYGLRLGKEIFHQTKDANVLNKPLKRKCENEIKDAEEAGNDMSPAKITAVSSSNRGRKSVTMGSVSPIAIRKSRRQAERKFSIKELFNIKDDDIGRKVTEVQGSLEEGGVRETTGECKNSNTGQLECCDNTQTVSSTVENNGCTLPQQDSSGSPLDSSKAEESKEVEQSDRSASTEGIGGKGIDWICMECKMVFKNQFGLIDHVQNEVHTNSQLIEDVNAVSLPESDQSDKQPHVPPAGVRKSTRIITPSPKKAAAEETASSAQDEDVHGDTVPLGFKKRGRGRPRKNQSERHLCEMCEKNFDSRTQLVQHYLKHHQDELDKLENVDIYSCLECGEGFWKKTDYESHMLKSHQGIPCKACDLTLTSMKAYNKHVLMHSEDLIPCGICSKRFMKTVLQAHLLEEHGRKDLACSMCSEKFPSTSLLTSHLILDHNIKLATQEENSSECAQNKSDNFSCDLCGAVCEEPGLYITHMHEVHHLLMFRCDYCERVFGTQSSLKKHLELTHSMKSEYFCEYCGKVFIHEPSMKRHVEEVHEQKTLPCDICLKIFPSQRRLHEHMRTVHKIIVSKQSTVIEDLFKCKICNQEMASKGNLRRHMAVHSGQGTESEFKLRNDLKCSLCGVQFNRRYLYMEHLAYHKAKGESVEDLDGSVDPDDVTCSLCGRVCTTKQNLHRHMAMHEEKPYACDLCDKKFLHEMSQKEHILSEHPEVDLGIDMSKTYKCETCPNIFLRRNVYNKHMRKHSNLVYKCSQCDSVFKRKDSVHRHNCRMDLDTQHVLTCDDCGASFKFKENMDIHECTEEDIIKYKEVKEKMVMEIDKFQCKVCLELFTDLWSLKRHKKKHLPKLHQCELCSRKFQFKTALKTHMKIHYKVVHDTEGNTQVVKIPYLKNSFQNICPECHCQFSTQKSFINHLKLFHSIVALPCTICPKVLTSEEDIIAHTEEHQQMVVTDSELKKQMVSCACNLCNQVFLEPARLAKHKRMAHEKQLEFMCDTCGKMFNRKDSLKAHIRTHTHETVADCKECNKRFKSRIAYDMHLKIHRNQRDFKCSFCEKTFIQKGNLNKHLLTHNQTFNFECDVCKRKFNNPALLKRHSLIHDEMSKLVCDLCGHKFTRQYFLNKHIKQHHEFQNSCHCEQCGTFLKTVASYRRHMRRKHPDVPAPDFNPVMFSDATSDKKLGNDDSDLIDEDISITGTTKEEEMIQIEHAKFDEQSGSVIQEISVPASSLSSVLGSVIQGNAEQGFTVHIIQTPEVVVTSDQDGDVSTLSNMVTGVTGTETILQLDDGTAANLTPDVVEGVRVLQQFVELSGRVSEAELSQATTQVAFETTE